MGICETQTATSSHSSLQHHPHSLPLINDGDCPIPAKTHRSLLRQRSPIHKATIWWTCTTLPSDSITQSYHLPSLLPLSSTRCPLPHPPHYLTLTARPVTHGSFTSRGGGGAASPMHEQRQRRSSIADTDIASGSYRNGAAKLASRQPSTAFSTPKTTGKSRATAVATALRRSSIGSGAERDNNGGTEMAFASKIGSLFKRAATASNLSVFQAIQCMLSWRLFIGGLSYNTDEPSLREAFVNHGEVVDARVIIDQETGRSKGFGFVTFTSPGEASTALSAMNGKGRIEEVVSFYGDRPFPVLHSS